MPPVRWIAIALLVTAPKHLPAQDDAAESAAPISVLVEQLLSDDQSMSHPAAAALGRRCESEIDWWSGTPEEIAAHEQVVADLKPFVGQLISALDRSDRSVQLTALACLSLLGPAAQDAAPRIWDLARRGILRDVEDDAPPADVLTASGDTILALAVLREILPDDVPAIEYAVRLLRELPEEQKRRLRETHVIRDTSKQGDTPHVESGSEVEYSHIASYVELYAVMFGRLGWGEVEVPGLLELSTSDFPQVVRVTAVLALGSMQQEAATALPALTKLLDSDDALLRHAAATALIVIQRDEAPLEEILARARLPQDDQVELREWLQELVAERRQEREDLQSLDARDDADAIRYYINALKHGRGSVRREVLRQLKEVGPAAAAALPEINAALNDPSEMTRRLAEEAIAAIQPMGGPGPSNGSIRR